jgi:hypothetical protein
MRSLPGSPRSRPRGLSPVRVGLGLGIALALTASLARAEARVRSLLVPPREGPDVNTLGVERDGTRRIVAFGLRARAHPDGAMEVGDEVFPLARGVQALELPVRFGRGFLFTISGSNRSSIWKAKSFTGKLEPFAQLDFEIERLAPGFDRVYVQARRTGEWAALDPYSGLGLDRGSLPTSPAFGAMAFADEWFGAVELPIRGVVASFDAGGSWHPLGRAVQILGEDGGELLLATAEGRRRLGPDGTLHPLEIGAGSIASDSAGDSPRRVAPEGPLGRAPLASALLRGFADTPETAVVAARGVLSRLRLSDGRVLETRPRALSASSECAALPLERGHGFACREPTGKTSLYAFKPPLGLRLLETFDAPRAIIASGNGGLVLRGSCKARPVSAGQSAGHCVRSPDGSHFDVTGAGGRERVVALRDGSAAKLLPPEAEKKGQLVLVAKNGAERTVPLVFDSTDEVTRGLLKQGFWLDALVEGADGKLSGWVLGQGVFSGVRIGLDGHVRLGPLRHGIERALLAGERALVIPSAGVAEQTVDGGKTFTDVDLPPELQLDSAKSARVASSGEQGCSALGCVFSGWLRVGWDGTSGGSPLPVAVVPKPTPLPQPGGGRWILRCAPTGESSANALPSAAPGGMAEGQAPWLGLFEQPPPARPRDSWGFDTGGDSALRAYVWGPKGADFSRSGLFLVSVLDAYRARSGVWSTLPAASPWSDPAQVAEVFGYEGSTPSAWQLTLDPSGRAGVLSVSVRGSTELFALEENRAAVRLLNAARQGVGSVSSAVRLGATFYVAAQEEARNLRIFALESGEARLVGQYADLAQGRGVVPTLVRSVRGDALGIWTRGSGWFVFPLDLRSGVVTGAIEITPPALSRLPRACAPDEEGYLLEGPIGIEPYVDFVDGAERISAHGYEGRFVVSNKGLCVTALSAQSDGAIARAPASSAATRTGTTSVPLVVADRSDRGRRWAFRCSD